MIKRKCHFCPKELPEENNSHIIMTTGYQTDGEVPTCVQCLKRLRKKPIRLLPSRRTSGSSS